MAKILLLVMSVCCWLWTTEGQPQSCTNGFPTMEEVIGSRRDEGSNDVLRIIPNVIFTCSGFITKWTLSAQFRSVGDEFVQLQVWRFVNGESAVKTGSTTITIRTRNISEIYEYRPETPLRVEVGDVLGIFQPNDPILRVHETEDGPTNYIVDLNNRPSPATVILASADDTTEALPLVTAEISISTTTSLRFPRTLTPIATISHTLIPHTPTATPSPSQPAMNGSASTSLRLFISHTPTATVPSLHHSQSGHPATNGSDEGDNTLVKAVVGGVVGGVVLSALIASVMSLLVWIKKKRTEMAESKEDISAITLREEESVDYIHIHDNKAYVPTAILTDQNAAYGTPEDYIINDTQHPSIEDEGYVVNRLLYEDIQSQSTRIGISDLSYDYAVVTY